MAEVNTLHNAFVDELRDIYDGEQQITKALPKMIEAASDDSLRSAFEAHLGQTQEQIQRLERVFDSLDEAVRGKHCDGMKGILDEGAAVLDESYDETTRDACLVSAAQRVEHYEMAVYGTLVSWARAMGHDDAADLLQTTLEEEKETDAQLSAIAEDGINQQAALLAHTDDEDLADDATPREPAEEGAPVEEPSRTRRR
jgi:ferritin-like metal-binding protein YciE